MPPLAEQLRPQSLEDVIGQDALLSKDGIILRSVRFGKPTSMILWGPPGSGKTSIARLYAKSFSMRYWALNATQGSVQEIKQKIQEVEGSPLFGSGLLLFVDEIHRFNKAQQDLFLPYIEKGTIVLIGATAENPTFYLNTALLSRVPILRLTPLDATHLNGLLLRYEKQFGSLPLTDEARQWLVESSQGDGRYLYNLIESIAHLKQQTLLDVAQLQAILPKRAALYDRDGDRHYQCISALHKSVRGSDPDAALYWFARMLEGGEDPLYIARRLLRMAVEDVGTADPQALSLAIAAMQTYERLGSPEGELALAEVVVYLALAPKSIAVYKAFNIAREVAKNSSHLPPPNCVLPAPNRTMQKMGFGQDYVYDPETPDSFSGQNYFPDDLQPQKFYLPVERGFEREMKKRIEYFNSLRK